MSAANIMKTPLLATPMTYQETLQYLFVKTPMFQQVGAKAYKPGLQVTETLDAHLGRPHRNYATIHVAGTNGKGSTAHLIAATLQSAGLRVGLYTSPHLVDFRERIRVNGEPVSEEYVVDFVEKERSFFEPLRPSFFEITTAMALRYFADARVDVAVIEVGLGGRLDCTNIISPLLSVITNISLEHTALLGNTLAEIAAEKGGIIKPATPVVIGERTPETAAVFRRIAEEKGAPLFWADEDDEILTSTRQSRLPATASAKKWKLTPRAASGKSVARSRDAVKDSTPAPCSAPCADCLSRASRPLPWRKVSAT